MPIPNELKDLKDVGIYCFGDDEKGNIIVNFRIDNPGNYTLKISEKDLKSMNSLSQLGKMLNKDNTKDGWEDFKKRNGIKSSAER